MEVFAFIRPGAKTLLLPDDDALHIKHVDYKKDLGKQFENLKQEIGQLDFFMHNAGCTVSLDNDEYYQVNVGMTKSICEALESSDLLSNDGKFIYTSSYAAHGPANTKQPVSHYGRSKREAEHVIATHMTQYMFARPTAIYGAGDVAFLPLFKSAKMGLYPVTDDAQKMSMIHAKDLANMMVADMQSEMGPMHYNDGNSYLHADFISIFEGLFERKIRKFPLPKWLAKLSMGSSDVWHKIIKKRPGITLEKFDEISQNWDLHTTSLKHSSGKATMTLKAGFEDALDYYRKNQLL